MNASPVVIEVPEKETCRKGCHSIGCRNADPHAVCSPKFWENQQERYEEYQLTAHRHEDAALCHTNALEEVACHNLETHNGGEQTDNPHTPACQFCECWVTGEEYHNVLREEHADDEVHNHDDGGKDDGFPQHLIHTVRLLGTKVETSNRLHALTDAQHHHDSQEGGTVHNTIGCNRQVPSMLCQSLVDENDHQTGTQLHGKG